MNPETSLLDAATMAKALNDLSQTSPTIYNDLAKPSVQNLGKALGTVTNILNSVLAPIEITNEVIRICKEHFLKAFSQKICEIPEDKICPPNYAVIGPITEKSKYKITEETLRQKYVNLLAASLNLDHCNKPLLSFNAVLDQLSPFEVQFLQSLLPSDKIDTLKCHAPIADIECRNKLGLSYVAKNIVPACSDFGSSVDSLAISSFERLGIIRIDKTVNMKPISEHYRYITESKYFKDLLKSAEEERLQTGSSVPTYNISPGIFYLTEFGASFIETVIL